MSPQTRFSIEPGLVLALFNTWSFIFFLVQCPDNDVLFDSTGVILSPGYPDSYPNLQMCSWMINVEKGYNITLHFELFQTEKEFDILEIFDGGFELFLIFRHHLTARATVSLNITVIILWPVVTLTLFLKIWNEIWSVGNVFEK